MEIARLSVASLLLALALPACAARRRGPPVRDATAIDMEAMRIVASHDGEGGYEFESYDASDLFGRANAALNAGHCEDAVVLYDRIVEEFSASVYVSPSLYNAGLCLADMEQTRALGYFDRLIRDLPDSPDVKHASFQAGHLGVELERFPEARAHAEHLLEAPGLPADERLEAMAIRAQALIGEGDLGAAAEQAREGLQYYRIQGSSVIPDEFFAGSLNFSLAETIRLRATSMTFPDTTQEEQRAILVRRAELLLEAQRAYFDTIRLTNAHWAAAAGHQIGGMYDTLWRDLMAAPVPDHLSEGAKEVYPQELAKLIKPLLRHAIRYWELTLMMIERTGVDTPWAADTRAGIEQTRTLLLQQPAGPGGLSRPVTEGGPPPDAEPPPHAVPIAPKPAPDIP